MGEGETVPVLLKEDGTPYKTAVLIPTINNADELDIVLERLAQANLASSSFNTDDHRHGVTVRNRRHRQHP